MRVQWIVTALFLVLAGFSPASTMIPGASLAADCTVTGGVIDHDTTWTLAASPYCVTSSVLVNPGAILNVDPGVTARFDSRKGLRIDGTLIARGTAQAPITFTSSQAVPTRGDWAGIHFVPSSVAATFDGSGRYAGGSVLDYSVIEYAAGAMQLESSSPLISRNVFKHNQADAIHSDGGAPVITGNTIADTSGNGIYVSGGVMVEGNDVSGSTGAGIYAVVASGDTASVKANVLANNATGLHLVNYYETDRTSIEDNTISGNRNGGDGGGILVINYRNVSVTITRNTVTGNAAGRGGGISFIASGTSIVTDNTISGNAASVDKGGGGVFVGGATSPFLEFNNIFGNVSGTQVQIDNAISVSNTDVQAPNNYWGTTDVSAIAASVWDFFDDAALGVVQFSPFLSSPVDITASPTATPTATPTPTATSTATPTPTATPTVAATPTMTSTALLDSRFQVHLPVVLKP